jgi:hypothetical protein
MLDQTRIRHLTRRSKVLTCAVRPETIPALARYLGITSETLSQLVAFHYLRESQAAPRRSHGAAMVHLR